MCASVIGKPDPQTEKLLKVIFGSGRNEKSARNKVVKENKEEGNSSR